MSKTLRQIDKDVYTDVGTYVCCGLNVTTHDGNDAKCVIGKYCSVSLNLKLILGANHRSDWISTFPFKDFPEFCTNKKTLEVKGHPTTKGDIIIGNDVWIGKNVTILSGVTIGDGCVIGCETVVTKSCPPYTIVVGNPGRCVKDRFPKEIIDKLLKIKWWNLPLSKINDISHVLTSSDFDAFFSLFSDILVPNKEIPLERFGIDKILDGTIR